MSRRWIGAAGVFTLMFAAYTASLAPGVFSWDSAELTLGIYTQGIVHATGYPLYLILGRLFTLLPLAPDFAVRANLFSAVCGALTVALVYMIGLRLTRRPIIAAASALLYGLAREIWAQAIVAEVYTLHTALVAGIFWLVVSRGSHAAPSYIPAQHHQAQGGFSDEAKYLYLIALLFGLAFANHLAALLVAAVLLPYLLWRATWRARLGMAAITGLTAALLYLYLPLRFAAQPEFNLVAAYFERDLTQPGDLLWMVSGRMFGREMLAYPLLNWLGEIGAFFGELWLNYLGVGALLGLLGIGCLWRANRTACLLFGMIFAAQVLFFSSYDVFDKWTMFHTAYLAWAIFVAAGCRALLDYLPAAPVYLFLAALVAAQFATNWNTAGRAGDTFVMERTGQLLAALPPDSTLIGPWTALRPVEYAQLVDGQRRDVILLDLTLLSLGLRDRLGGDQSSALSQAVDEHLRHSIACAPAEVYVVDPAALDAALYQVAFVQSGLYRVTAHPAADC